MLTEISSSFLAIGPDIQSAQSGVDIDRFYVLLAAIVISYHGDERARKYSGTVRGARGGTHVSRVQGKVAVHPSLKDPRRAINEYNSAVVERRGSADSADLVSRAR